MARPAMSEPGTASYEAMKKPWSRMCQSIGLSAIDLTSVRSSSAAGAGVGRCLISSAEPFEVRMATR